MTRAEPALTDSDVGLEDDVHLKVDGDAAIVDARQAGRRLAEEAGFGSTDLTLIATAISEIARNMVTYAGHGQITMRRIEGRDRVGIEIVAEDEGPGIPDIERAIQDGYTTGRGLGLGLPGARRLMDEFSIESTVGRGTTVVMRRWAPRRA
jgi:serine/threonine-protein kinase RsbT